MGTSKLVPESLGFDVFSPDASLPDLESDDAVTDSCPSCSKPVPPKARFCGDCGAALESQSILPTEAAPSGASALTSSQRGRFELGTILAERYRIIEMLGRGGMGEVYRAEDLKLDQPVALKFLPTALEGDRTRLQLLLNEVKLARQVAHPNVCRVYDIIEAEGSHFMAMEYVDGEDLSSLLRRIGRLPHEKAVEISRQICAGLSAAHEQGILHRDLKPANVMIDSQGRVKLADFGLAAITELAKDGERVGTLAYMSPEQLDGRNITVRSDIYALGLVLYEVFTGQSVFSGKSVEEIRKLQTQSRPTNPSTIFSDIDESVARMILRCLERDPAERPASALAVSAGLPGGDPLAAALAAGETPSPEMVADAGVEGALRPAVAWGLLAAFLALLVVNIMGSERYHVIARADLPKSGEVLQSEARTILASIGYEDPIQDSLLDFSFNYDYLRFLAETDSTPPLTEALARSQPSALSFGYRQSPSWIIYESQGSIGGWIERSVGTTPGEIRMRLDPAGRLTWLDVVPPDFVGRKRESTDTAPWGRLLTAAGFDTMDLNRAEPEWYPPRAFDTRQAWIGAYPEAPDVPIRVEAASLDGHITGFRIVEPWTQSANLEQPPLFGPATGSGLTSILAAVLAVLAFGAAGFFAWRNARLGRGDHRTAVRFALLLCGLRFLWYVFGRHIGTSAEVGSFMAHLAWSSYRLAFAYALYLAIEPYARRMWPHMLTSWVRLFDNRFSDPLVGRDVLIGFVLLEITIATDFLSRLVAGSNPVPQLFVESLALEGLRGTSAAAVSVVSILTDAAFAIFILSMFLLVARLLLRRDILTLVATLALATVFGLDRGLPGIISGLVFGACAWIALFRFGMLTFATVMIFGQLLRDVPLTFDLSAWWAKSAVIALCLSVGLALWSFRTSMGGAPVFRDRVFDD